MTPAEDAYVRATLARYVVPTGPNAPVVQAAQALVLVVQAWAQPYLLDIQYSGSCAKGTGVQGGHDLDLFISLNHQAPMSLKEIYWHLVQYLQANGWNPRPQNVSVGVTWNGTQVDLVPGKKQAGATTDHSLYKRKADTWIQTNIDQHVNLVKNSGRTTEIRAVKLWRRLRGLDFPSFYLELTVIDALHQRPTTQPAGNVIAALQYIEQHLPSARVMDPANSNNEVSDELTAAEKRALAAEAGRSWRLPNWNQIIW